MPEKATTSRARSDLRKGKAKSTAAGEFVREEMEHIREGKHGARSAKQAIAIGLSKARRAGIDPGKPRTKRARKQAKRDTARAHSHKAVSRTRSRATSKALKREGHAAASHKSLARQAHRSASRRTHAQRSASARKAAATRKREAA